MTVNDIDGYSCEVEAIARLAGMDGVAGRPKVAGNNKLALDALREALIASGTKPPASNHIPQNPDNLVCPVEIWKTYFNKLKAGEPDSKRRTFVRAVDKLQSSGIIGIWDDLVWLAGQRRTK